MPMKKFKVEFTKDGQVFDQKQVTDLRSGLDGVTDLFVVAHGWNNDMADAQKLYDELLGHVDALLGDLGRPELKHLKASASNRVFAVAQVFWPSKKFTDEELIPGGGAASAAGGRANGAALKKALDRLADDPDRLGKKSAPAVRKKLVERAKKLAAKLDKDKSARAEFVSVLRQLLNPDQASHDDASVEFFTADAEKLFKAFEGDVLAPGAVKKGGGAAAVGKRGGAAGIRDLFKGAVSGARRIANFATYYQMKTRAGTVGATGVAAMLNTLRAQRPNVKLHLVGHSFGGRVVVAAANALPNKTPGVSMSLLQAAFSHNGLSENFAGGEPGFFRQVVASKRAPGPIIITHTKNDTAVGVAYPLASRIALQKAAALGDADDPYGGMGRNGAQKTKEVSKAVKTLAKPGHAYAFKAGEIYNLLADDFIKDHSDVRSQEVAYAVLSAALAV